MVWLYRVEALCSILILFLKSPPEISTNLYKGYDILDRFKSHLHFDRILFCPNYSFKWLYPRAMRLILVFQFITRLELL